MDQCPTSPPVWTSTTTPFHVPYMIPPSDFISLSSYVCSYHHEVRIWHGGCCLCMIYNVNTNMLERVFNLQIDKTTTLCIDSEVESRRPPPNGDPRVAELYQKNSGGCEWLDVKQKKIERKWENIWRQNVFKPIDFITSTSIEFTPVGEITKISRKITGDNLLNKSKEFPNIIVSTNEQALCVTRIEFNWMNNISTY